MNKQLFLGLIGSAILTTLPVKAAQIGYTFDIDITSGSLTGNSYSGSFGYDDSGLTGSGDEFIEINAFDFDFNGTTFGLGDLEPLQRDAVFFDGDFLGLDTSDTTDVFAFVPGFFDISEAFFTYDVPSIGEGNINYVVPEPLTLLGASTAISLGTLFKRRSRRQS